MNAADDLNRSNCSMDTFSCPALVDVDAEIPEGARIKRRTAFLDADLAEEAKPAAAEELPAGETLLPAEKGYDIMEGSKATRSNNERRKNKIPQDQSPPQADIRFLW
jgi:hypothetical protein